MSIYPDQVLSLQTLLAQNAVSKTKAWWEGYMRGAIPFRGVGIPVIRKLLAEWRQVEGIATWGLADQLGLALQLFESPIAEDKLAGILFLQDYLYDQFSWEILLEKYAGLYARGLIFDWNTCDWFCVRVLGPTIAKHGSACASALAAWAAAENLWQARSAVVAFIPVTAESAYHPLIYTACSRLIRREERFAKTAVGWILHDLSKLDETTVRQFVDQNLSFFSVEALNNALKYFEAAERKEYLKKFKA